MSEHTSHVPISALARASPSTECDLADLCPGAQTPSLRNAPNAAFMMLSTQERNVVFLVHIFSHLG